MSLRSMTGYGRGVASGKGLHVEVEVSSVNRKQLDEDAHNPASPMHMLARWELFTVDQQFGGWAKAQKAFFGDGGEVDRAMAAR